MKIFSGFRIFIAIVIAILVMIFLSGQFKALWSFAAVGVSILIVLTILAQFGKLPAPLMRLAGRVADKSPAIAQTQQASPAAPIPAAAPRMAPSTRPQKRTSEKSEEWQPKQFRHDLSSLYSGLDDIAALEREITAYITGHQKRPLLCIVTGPKWSGKTALCYALLNAFGEQLPPEHVSRTTDIHEIDAAFIARPETAVLLVDSIGKNDESVSDILSADVIKNIETFCGLESRKIVFLFIRAKEEDLNPDLIEEAKTRLSLEVLSSSPALSRLAFKQFFFMDHDIIIEIDETEKPELEDNLYNHIAQQVGNDDFSAADINERLKGPVKELVRMKEFEPKCTYALIDAPPPNLDGSVNWTHFEFEEIKRDE